METTGKSLLFLELIEQNKDVFYKVATTYCQNENERQDQLKERWKTTNSELEDSLSITRQNTEDITKMKVQTLLL